jgi:hypothetical protein
MARRRKQPELTFQEHIADFLVRVHGYGVLEQTDITDTEHCLAEDQLWAFLKATQADTLQKLADDYGTDARDEVFRALSKELERTPLWMLLRQSLKVRGLEFRLFYPKPRSAESAAVEKHGENRITFRPHFYFGPTGQEIDFVFFLNGLPIVALEVKHEKNQNVHDAVAQFASRDHGHAVFRYPFLYLAADTSDVMAATDPRRAENFRWHNMGLTNTPQTDAHDFVALVAAATDAQVQFSVNGLCVRFQTHLTSLDDRKAYVHLLARFVKAFHFMTCFVAYPEAVKEFVVFAEVVGPQLIKQGSVSDLMKQIRRTEVVKASVEFQGEVRNTGGEVKLRPGGGKKGVGPSPRKVSVQDMIDEIRAKFTISDEEALYIRQVTEEKVADPGIRVTVLAHRDDRIYLDGAYRGQVNWEIQDTYNDLARYEELADPKYTDTGGIFDIMAVTIIQTHLAEAA